MARRLSTIAMFFALFTSVQVSAQYVFESKKAEKLYNKIEGYYENYEYDKILKSEDDITELYLSKTDTLGALMYSFLGEAYLYWGGDMEKALSFYQKEYDLRKKLGDQDLSTVIFNLGYIKDELGRYNETEALYLELLEIENKAYGKSSEEYYTSAFTLAEHYMYVEDVEKGLVLCKELRKYTDKQSLNEAMIQKIMGDFYTLGGLYSQSEKSLSKALDLMDDLGLYASIEYVNILVSYAGLKQEIGKLPEAEDLFFEARSILDRLQGDQSEYVAILEGNMALNYMDLGNYNKAEELLLKTYEVDKQYYGEESYQCAVDAGNLGDNYKYANKPFKAEEYYNIASEIYTEIVGEESIENARMLMNKASVNVQKGYPEKASTLAEKAVDIFEKKSAAPAQMAFAHYSLGESYLASNNLEKASKEHLKALQLRKKAVGQNHDHYALSTLKLAILHWKKKDYKTALAYYQETFNNYYNQINLIFPILSEEEKTKFYYNKFKPAFEQYNSFIIETSSENKALVGEMYNNQLATKGIVLSATNKVREAILGSGDSVLIGQYRTWIGQKEQLAKLFSTGDMSVETRNKKIDSLTKASNSLEKALSESSSEFASVFISSKKTWQDVRKTLKPGEAAVEVIRFRGFSTENAGEFTEEIYYAALVVTTATKEAPEMVIMRNGKLMESRYLSNYRNAIKYKINEDYSYRLFWKPIANKLVDINKVYLSPDGVFNQISIYTLRNPETNKFLIDEMEVQVITNSNDLLSMSAPAQKGQQSNSYLFGYPNYNMGVIDKEMENQGANSSAEAAVKAASENRGRGMSRGGVRGGRGTDRGLAASRGGSLPRGLRGNMLRYMRSNQLLALLPGTKKEVGLIDSLYQGMDAQVTTLLSNDALEDSLKAVDNPKTLHIATHGFFLESGSKEEGVDEYVENPLLRSGLILAGANSFIASGLISDEIPHNEDGILTAYEVMNLNLDNTELVVLSACETGLGEIKNGEGVYGLQRAFRVAGADAMIMSMWTVDDDATQELMTTFYQEWLSGKGKHEAFITAQKTIKDKWKAPYYWGAFIMVGN